MSEFDYSKVIDLLEHGDISGWFGNSTGGPYLQELEKKFAQACGAKYAFGVSSGSASIYVGLKACGVGPGDVVPVPAYTHVGSVAPIVLAGATPLFIDVDDYGDLDPNDLEHVLTARSLKIKAVVVVHQLGVPCNMIGIRSVVGGDVAIVEDASHALGGRYAGHSIPVGNVGCFSIGGGRTKTIGTGEGGMVVTNDDELAEKCRNIRNHGDRAMDVPYFCFNFRMSDLNAAVGLAQIEKLDFLNKHQAENAKYIVERLPNFLSVPKPPEGSTWYIIGCYFDEHLAGMSRGEFLKIVEAKGFKGGLPRKNIGSGYVRLISDMKLYQSYWRFLAKSEWIRDHSVWIDWHRWPRTKEEIDTMLDCLRSIGKR